MSYRLARIASRFRSVLLACGVFALVGVACAQPASSIPLGGFTSPTTINTAVTLSAGQIQWYAVDIPAAFPINLANYLDIHTNAGSPALSNGNTIIALYNATCGRVTIDDEDGPGSYSALSYGCTISRPAIGGSLPFNGRDGTLAAGRYYLAVAASPTTYPAASCPASNAATATGQVTITATLGQCILPAASPACILWGRSSLLTINTGGYAVTSVTVDLTPIGGASGQTMFDNATNGDLVPGDGIYSLSIMPTFGGTSPFGDINLPATVVTSGNAVPVSIRVNLDEAGDTPKTARLIGGSSAGTTPLTSISGQLCGDDADMYLIRVPNPATFTATTVGGATFDTQLFLFNMAGIGVAANDDNPGTPGVLQSTISSAFTILRPAENYYLAISQYNKDPRDFTNALLWNDLPYETERAPDGPGALNPVGQWNSNPTTGGAYTISFTGATKVPAAAAPIPACLTGWFAMDDGACDSMGGKGQTSNYAPGGGSNGMYSSMTGGPQNVMGLVAGALFFDGIDDYITFANYPAITITSGTSGSFSAMAWINPDAAASTASNKTILDTKGEGTVGYRFFLRPNAGLCGTSAWELACEIGLGGTPRIVGSGICITRNQWSNVSVTVSWPSGASVTPTFRFYVSHNAAGQYQKSTPAVPAMPNLPGSNAATSPRIGARAGSSPSDFFHGIMDEVMLFKCAISEATITGIHAAGAAGVSKGGVQAPWEFASKNETNIAVPITIINDSTDTRTFQLFYSPSTATGPGTLCTVDGILGGSILPNVITMLPRTTQTVPLPISPPMPFTGHACYDIVAVDAMTGEVFRDQGTIVDDPVWWASVPPNADPLYRQTPIGMMINFQFQVSNLSPSPRNLQYRVHALDADTWTMNSPIAIQVFGGPPGNPVPGNIFVPPHSSAIIPITAFLQNLPNQPGLGLVHEIALFADIDNDGDISFFEDLASMALRPIQASDECLQAGNCATCGCVADVDDGTFTGTPDGGVTIDDLLYYLFLFENGSINADVDDGSFTGHPDGGVTIDDLLYYLFRFEMGC